MKLQFIVDEKTSGKTVRQILKNNLDISERLMKKLKYDNKIFCNSTPVRINQNVNCGDIIETYIKFDEECDDIIPEDIEIDIIYEDDCLMVLNKQADIVVHPTCSHPSGTIANAIMYYLLKQGEKRKIRPVSRLDRDTTGVIIFAKNQYIQESLIRQMHKNIFQKEYIGVVHGIVKDKFGTINLPIERKPGSIMLRHVSPTGLLAVTHYEVIEYLNNCSFLKFILETGRTHQIRVHCQAIGHPLIGDTLYCHNTDNDVFTTCQHDNINNVIKRQALHSSRVNFIHPYTREIINLSAPIPHDINELLEIMKK